MWVGLATQVKTLRLPEDVVETINDFPGSTFTEKFVATARLLGRDRVAEACSFLEGEHSVHAG